MQTESMYSIIRGDKYCTVVYMQAACLLWEHRRQPMQNTTWSWRPILHTPAMSRMIEQVWWKYRCFHSIWLLEQFCHSACYLTYRKSLNKRRVSNRRRGSRSIVRINAGSLINTGGSDLQWRRQATATPTASASHSSTSTQSDAEVAESVAADADLDMSVDCIDGDEEMEENEAVVSNDSADESDDWMTWTLWTVVCWCWCNKCWVS